MSGNVYLYSKMHYHEKMNILYIEALHLMKYAWQRIISQDYNVNIRILNPQEVLLAQFSLYVHKGGLKPDSFHFVSNAMKWNKWGSTPHLYTYRLNWVRRTSGWWDEWGVTALQTRVGAKYIGTCTYLYLSTFFRVLACTLYLSFKNVLVPKYITKYLVVEDKYIASTSVLLKKYIIIYFFSYSVP